jgi:hypothetical protein
MNRRTAVFAACFLASVLALGAFGSRAQEEPQQPAPNTPQQPTPDTPQQPAPDTPYEPFPGAPPKPAGYSFPGVIGPGGGELQPDFSPLTGFQNTTLGFPEYPHSYWVPGLQYSSSVQAFPSGTGGTSWSDFNYFLGNLSLVKAWSRATFSVNYSGGGFVTTNSGQGNGFYQQLALSQNYRSERWLLQIIDYFAQSPQSQFGFGGGSSLGVPGVGGSLGTTIPGLGGNYGSYQNIYGVGPFISNVGAVQATYALTHRSSITLAGSYGLMHFTQPGNIDNNTTVGSIGYNYALSRNDTVGLVYRFSSFQFPGSPQAYGDHVMSVAYGRKVTGRLALRLFVGPEITIYRIPIGTTSRTTSVYVSAHATYGFRRGSFAVSYDHGLSGGSGVLVGSTLDQASVSYSQNLTRVWAGNLNFGYSRNSPVGGTTTTGYPVYSNWFVGGGLSRPIGRSLNFGVAYTATIGDYGGSACTGAGCTTYSTYNTVTINFQWHTRPFVLQ